MEPNKGGVCFGWWAKCQFGRLIHEKSWAWFIGSSVISRKRHSWEEGEKLLVWLPKQTQTMWSNFRVYDTDNRRSKCQGYTTMLWPMDLFETYFLLSLMVNCRGTWHESHTVLLKCIRVSTPCFVRNQRLHAKQENRHWEGRRRLTTTSHTECTGVSSRHLNLIASCGVCHFPQKWGSSITLWKQLIVY